MKTILTTTFIQLLRTKKNAKKITKKNSYLEFVVNFG